MITREMIRYGFDNGTISIEDRFEPAGCVSLCCRIGDGAFYFAGMEDENLTSEEYLESYTMDEIIDMLYDILKDVKSANENGLDSSELEYYEAVLKTKIMTENQLYSWDELYKRAEGTGCGDPELNAKDQARYELSKIIEEKCGYDIEICECPEAEIDSFLWQADKEYLFDEDGHFQKVVNKTA